MKDGYIAVSAAKNYFSIHFSEEGYVTNIARMVPACKTGKQCINIKYGDDESYQIVKDHVRDFCCASNGLWGLCPPECSGAHGPHGLFQAVYVVHEFAVSGSQFYPGRPKTAFYCVADGL